MLKSKDYFSAVRIFYSAARILPLSFLSSLIASPALCRTWIQCSYNCYCGGSTNICSPKMYQRSGLLMAHLYFFPLPESPSSSVPCIEPKSRSERSEHKLQKQLYCHS